VNDSSAPFVNTDVPHSARVWNYWLGGKDFYPADREFGDRIYELFPDIVEIARQGRAFLGRAITYLAGEVGIRQFLDIGTGFPTAENTHEIAQRIIPDARIVYVDHDPLVLVHARALLVGTPEGAISYVEADVHDPKKILYAAVETLDFTQPIGLLMLGILGNVADLDKAYAIMSEFRDALPSGSYLVFRDSTTTFMSADRAAAINQLHEDWNYPYTLRAPKQLAHFLDGFVLVEPGLVSTPLWRPSPSDEPPSPIDDLCAVCLKP
jgi:hypothetical protein